MHRPVFEWYPSQFVRRILPFVAVALIYLMTPASGEIVENLVHLVATGHAAHAAHDEPHQQGPEHGCSGPFHVCACHSSVAFTGAVAEAIGSVSVPAAHDVRWAYAVEPSDGCLHGVFRPPIA